jgi:HAD superfamily hydrolase (TIGR01490 family)
MKQKRSIAFFDFDGTITRSDSFVLFLKYLVGYLRFYRGFLLLTPAIFLYLIRVLKDYQLKRIVSRYFLRGRSKEELEKHAKVFQQKILPDILREEALERIAWHHDQGHEVVLVSASFELWLKDFAEQYKMILISSRLECIKGIITGNLEGKNCKGVEKVSRIRESFKIEEYDRVYAYGDSTGDKEMLEIADEKHFRPFRREEK